MSSGSVTVPPGEGVAPLNFIYACSVCCYALTDVYEGHRETVLGLSDGINPKDRLVTHLWLASCCHVFCSSHLEAGGPEFHPDGQRPKAPCPVCIREKKDDTSKDLYSIRGFRKDEYDPMIPAAWFNAPPITLDGNGGELEAFRFQYLALVRYCQNTHATRKPLQDALAQAESDVGALRKLSSSKHQKVLSLQQEVNELRCLETAAHNLKKEVERRTSLEHELERYRRLDVNPKDLAMFQNNKDAIKQYLKLIPSLVDQNMKMKERLASLGFAMALEPIPNLKTIDLSVFESDNGSHGFPVAKQRETTSSHTVGRSAHASGEATASSSPAVSRPAKRPRLERPLSGNMQIDPPTSRDRMPPPQKPVSRIPSISKILPTLRRKFGSGRLPSTKKFVSDQTTQRGGQCEDFDNVSGDENRPLMRYGNDEEEPYMSGALPVESSIRFSGSSETHFTSSIGFDHNNTRTTLPSSSPMKMSMQNSVQLPILPSYIRLMDGLSRDDDVELGLRDPRESSSSKYQSFDNRTRNIADHSNRDSYRHLEDNDTYNVRQPHHTHQPEQISLATGNFPNSSPFGRDERSPIRRQQNPVQEVKTPASRCNQQSNHPIENIVSPLKMSSYRTSSPFANTGVTEPQDSSTRSGAYLSERRRTKKGQLEKREPCSLNGLSFFETPLDSYGQPIEYINDQHEVSYSPPTRPYQNRYLDSNGFILRPGAAKSHFFRESANQISHNQSTASWQQKSLPGSSIRFPSLSCTASPKKNRLPAAMPSIASGWSSLHSQPQGLSSQHPSSRSGRNQVNATFNSNSFSTRNSFSRAGRRSVRR